MLKINHMTLKEINEEMGCWYGIHLTLKHINRLVDINPTLEDEFENMIDGLDTVVREWVIDAVAKDIGSSKWPTSGKIGGDEEKFKKYLVNFRKKATKHGYKIVGMGDGIL